MTEVSAQPLILAWFRRARQSLEAARDDQKANRLELAASRAYFAAFSSAVAVFLLRGKRFKKHAGIRTAIHRDLVKAGLLDPSFGQAYGRLFSNRQRADYEDVPNFNAAHIARLITDAEAFVAEMERLAAKP